MTIELRIFLAACVLIFAGIIVHSLVQKKYNLRYSLVWLFSVIFMLIVIVFPNIFSFFHGYDRNRSCVQRSIFLRDSVFGGDRFNVDRYSVKNQQSRIPSHPNASHFGTKSARIGSTARERRKIMCKNCNFTLDNFICICYNTIRRNKNLFLERRGS